MQADSAIALYLFEESKIDFSVVDDVTVSDTPPWSQSELKRQHFKKTAQTLKSINKLF